MTLEDKMAEEAALLRLADAWVERTRGEVVPGVVWDASTYIRELKKVPLFERVKGELEECAKSVRKGKGWENYEAFLVYFPSARHVIEHFLMEPDYCSANGGNKFGSPKKLETLLKGYICDGENGECGVERWRGDAVRVGDALYRKKFTGEELLEAVGLRENWEAYQKTKGIPLAHKREAKKVIEHFLREPDYCSDRCNKFGSPKKLNTVLRDYVAEMDNGEGGFGCGKGNAYRVGHALSRKKFGEEELLDAIGLREKWEAYQKTRGIPKTYKKEAKKVIEHFLREPDYCCGGCKKFGSPKGFLTVLRDYIPNMNDGKGSFEKCKGYVYRIGNGLYHKKFTEPELLGAIRLKEPWQDYQNTTADNPFVYDPKKYEKKPEGTPR